MADSQTILASEQPAPPWPAAAGGPHPAPTLGALLRADLGTLLAAAALTLVLELGAYFLALWSGTPARGALLVSLAVATMWVALASAPLAAGGRGNLSAALRGAVPADASLLALLILWPLARGQASGPYLSLAGIGQVYCVLAAMAVFSIAAVACGRGPAARQGLAVAAAALLAAAIATPFWTSGIVHSLPYDAAIVADSWAIRANPFYAVTGALSGRVGFFWHEWGLMYERFGTFRAYPPPPVQWYPAPILYAALAAVLTLAAILRARLGRKTRRAR